MDPDPQKNTFQCIYFFKNIQQQIQCRYNLILSKEKKKARTNCPQNRANKKRKKKKEERKKKREKRKKKKN